MADANELSGLEVGFVERRKTQRHADDVVVFALQSHSARQYRRLFACGRLGKFDDIDRHVGERVSPAQQGGKGIMGAAQASDGPVVDELARGDPRLATSA